MSKLVGYARISTQDQNLTLQIDALIEAGCKKSDIYTDKVSGARKARPGLDACISELKMGDTLIVWRLDRLGRSMSHLVQLIKNLQEMGVRFRSLCDGAIDTTTASGELIFNIFSSLSQFERSLIQERTRAGLSAARARGRRGGRKKVPHDAPKVLMAKKMHKDHSIGIDDICNTLKISRPTLYRYLRMSD